MAWLDDWCYRMPVVIDSSLIDGDLTDFVVSFALPEVVRQHLLWEEYRRIAVTTDDGTSQCYVEIEKGLEQETNNWAQALLYVRVPLVHSGQDTILYLYFDAGKEPNTTFVGFPGDAVAAQVWDSNYVFVSHDGGGTDSTLKQSGTITGTSLVAGGPSPRARYFNGSSKIEYPHNSSLNLSEVTLECWFSFIDKNYSTYPRIVSKSYEGSMAYELIRHSLNQRMWAGRFNTGYISATQDVQNDVWYSMAMSFSVSEQLARLFLNGVQDSSLSASSLLQNTIPLFVGFGEYDRYFKGYIDELRVSSIGRSPAYHKASFHAMNGTLVSTLSVETSPEISGCLDLFRVNHQVIGGVVPVSIVSKTAPGRVGAGSVVGTVNVLGSPAKRRVALLDRRSMKVLAVTWSDPITGAYEFKGFDPRFDYLVICDDYTKTYNAAAADWVKPEVS